jgi:hypothetical protein
LLPPVLYRSGYIPCFYIRFIGEGAFFVILHHLHQGQALSVVILCLSLIFFKEQALLLRLFFFFAFFIVA